ncbi:MAG: virulence factor [Pseudomonadota bacterium]
MVKQILIYWRDIPAQVIVQRGRQRHKAKLSSRFEQAIDRAAMRAGKGSSDLYMAEWRRVASRIETELPLDEYAASVAADIEAQFGDEELKALIRNHGSAEEG